MAAAVFLLEADLLGFGAPGGALLASAPVTLIPAAVELERSLEFAHVIEADRAGLVEGLEVRRVDKVAHRDAVDVKEELLDGIGDFVVVEAIGLRPGGVEVGGGVDQHLGEFVRGRDADLVLLLPHVLDIHLRHRQAVGREVVKALERGVVVGIEEDDRPVAGKEAGGPHQPRGRSPDRREVVVDELLHRSDEGVEVETDRGVFRFVEDGDVGYGRMRCSIHVSCIAWIWRREKLLVWLLRVGF